MKLIFISLSFSHILHIVFSPIPMEIKDKYQLKKTYLYKRRENRSEMNWRKLRISYLCLQCPKYKFYARVLMINNKRVAQFRSIGLNSNEVFMHFIYLDR